MRGRRRVLTGAALVLVLLVSALAFAGWRLADDGDERPRAANREIWAFRLEPFVKRMGKNAQVLNGLRSQQIRIYLYSRNPDTLRILRATLRDLGRCEEKVERIGPPPVGERRLVPIHRDLGRACKQYEEISDLLSDGLPLITSNDLDDQDEGERIFRKAEEPSRLAALYYGRALEGIRAEKLINLEIR